MAAGRVGGDDAAAPFPRAVAACGVGADVVARARRTRRAMLDVEPSSALPEMTLRAPAAVPPIVVAGRPVVESTPLPPLPLGGGAGWRRCR